VQGAPRTGHAQRMGEADVDGDLGRSDGLHPFNMAYGPLASDGPGPSPEGPDSSPALHESLAASPPGGAGIGVLARYDRRRAAPSIAALPHSTPAAWTDDPPASVSHSESEGPPWGSWIGSSAASIAA